MRTRIALLALVMLAVTAGSADARRRRSMGGEKYVSNGEFGIGLELGFPSGFNGKYFLSDDRALNFGIGWIEDGYYYDDRAGFHLYLDHLWHPFLITKNPTFQMPFYIGVGARLWNFDDRSRGFDDEDGFALGVRCPLGLTFDFNKVPIDIFVQLTFAVDVFFGYRDRGGFHAEGSFGIRYWFD